MLPPSVEFTGLSVDPSAVLCRRLHGPAPDHWTRHQFEVDSWHGHEIKLAEWITQRLHYRWAMHSLITSGRTVVVVYFEEDVDAVMFRMMDGETAWNDTQEAF